MSDRKKNTSQKEVKKNQESEIDYDEKLDSESGSEELKENPVDEEKKEASIESLQEQLEQLQEYSKENLDKAIRAQAEMENLRKRTTRDVENAHKYALEKFATELLPVMDSLELGLSASTNVENVDDLRKGMELTLEMFGTVMEKFGITTIAPEGEKFNPELHEAVSMQEVECVDSGIIVTVIQKGYVLNERLIRPAMVVVAK